MTLLINEYHDPLFYGAIKSGLATDQAEEVVQGTWSTFFIKAENFQGRSHIRTYLFGILYNKIKEIWRSNKKYTHDFEESFDQLFDEYGYYQQAPLDPSSWSENQEFHKILKEELENLPENQRLAFYLKEIIGESTHDICNIMAVTSTNLGVLIYRAKNTLRRRLEKRLNL